MEHSKELKIIFTLVRENGGEARFVGGAVRDFLLKGKPLESGDVDLAVNLPPEKVAEIFINFGAKVVTQYATNIVILNYHVFEITSTRKDENCDGRYAKMIFTPSFEEDSKRRDFTINALYMNESGEIFDYNGGKTDLQQKIVRFIGNPEFRIEEDYLRIWRFFRFSCLYAKGLNEEGFEAVIKKKIGLAGLSKERVTSEMLKLLTGEEEKIYFYVQKMIEAGVLSTEHFHLHSLQHKLPNEPFMRLLCLTNAVEVPYFLYTKEQRKFLSLYNKIRNNLKKIENLYFYHYTVLKKNFSLILQIANFLHETLPDLPEFQNAKNLPFSFQTIMEEGYKGVEISKQFEIKLKEFIKLEYLK